MADKYSVTICCSIYQSLNSLLLLNRVSLVFHHEVVKSSTNVRLVWGRKYQILSFVMVFVSVVLSAYGLTVNFQNEVVRKIRLRTTSGRIITFLDSGLLIFTSLAIVGILITNFRHLSRYLKLLSEVDEILRYTSKSHSDTTILAAILLFTGSTFIADICIWSSLLPTRQIMSYALHQLPIYSMYYIHLLVILNFHFLVKLLISRVAFLSNLLQDSCRVREYNFSVLTECLLGDELQNFSSLHVVDDMVHIYDLMYEASLSLNKYYGIILLFALVGCLLHLLVTPFDLVLEIFHKHYSFIFLQTTWMLGHVLRLLLILIHVSKSVKR
nr:unnamed protein product [Callosobruchus analis]